MSGERAVVTNEESEVDLYGLQALINAPLDPTGAPLSRIVEITEKKIEIRRRDGRPVLRWTREEWTRRPEAVPEIAQAVQIAIQKGPVAVREEMGRPIEAPGTWSGSIWGEEPDQERATYRWYNDDPSNAEAAYENAYPCYEIEMYTEPGQNWNVSFFEVERSTATGDVVDGGIAAQPRMKNHPINPGQERRFEEAMRYVEDLMH